MANITIAVSDDTYRRARIAAAERETSVSALVSAYLESLVGADAEFARLEALQQQVQDELGYFTAGDRVVRDAVHDRGVH